MSSSQMRRVFAGFVGRARGQWSAEFDRRVGDSLELIAAGERGIAFENLAQNLYEFDVRIAPYELSELDDIGQTLGLEPDTWSFLGGLVRD